MLATSQDGFMQHRFVAAFVCLVMFCLTLGCDVTINTTDLASGGQDSDLVLDKEPAGPISIENAVKMFGGEQSDEEPKAEPVAVTLVGRVHAGDHSPFTAGEASFLLSELPDPAHGDGSAEHADSCPFCKRRAEKQTKALVQFVDSDSQVIKTDARELLGIEKGDTVVIQGTGLFDPAVNLLKVNATGLFPRRDS